MKNPEAVRYQSTPESVQIEPEGAADEIMKPEVVCCETTSKIETESTANEITMSEAVDTQNASENVQVESEDGAIEIPKPEAEAEDNEKASDNEKIEPEAVSIEITKTEPMDHESASENMQDIQMETYEDLDYGDEPIYDELV